MFQSSVPSAVQAGGPRLAYAGPERRHADRDPATWLCRMLDEIDFGMLLVNALGPLRYLNPAAQREINGQHPLVLRGRVLQTPRHDDDKALLDALAAAHRGQRRLLTLGPPDDRLSVSVVPLSGDGGSALTLLVLGKREVCERLSVQGFASSLHLTPAETRVLEFLCAGMRPNDIAARCDVAVSTARTQISSIRAKADAGSIQELLRRVAVVPPLLGALRGTNTAAPD